ncbi:MAG: hypothetical protein AAF684_07665, partial [Pseudomonadota bacterium]
MADTETEAAAPKKSARGGKRAAEKAKATSPADAAAPADAPPPAAAPAATPQEIGFNPRDLMQAYLDG